jgi:hypothetical protein
MFNQAVKAAKGKNFLLRDLGWNARNQWKMLLNEHGY